MPILNKQFQTQLDTWLGGKKGYTLLYQATRDECNGQTFHQLCNNKGPTVTLCQNTAGFVFGGYTAINWTNDVAYCNDGQAFLFRLLNGNGFKAKKYSIKQSQYAIYTNGSYGPTFGNGHDLCPFTGQVNKTGDYFQGNNANAANLGTAYNNQGDDIHAFIGNNLHFTEIEVYQITAAPAKADVAEAPWRKIRKASVEDLMKTIESYSPPSSSKIRAVNILLLGPVGAGKSSFFNTVNSVFQGEISALARCGSADHSLTTTYRRYRVRSAASGEPLKIRFCDTRGLENDGGLDVMDLMAVVEGHVPDRFQFNTTVPISPESTGYNSEPIMDDKIHCVAFIIDGTAVDVFPSKILETFKALQKRLNPKGIPQVAIITKADKACSEAQEDVGQMFHSETIKDAVEKGGELLGLPGSCVFPVKNYSSEVDVDDQMNLPVLVCLKQILRYAEEYIQDGVASD